MGVPAIMAGIQLDGIPFRLRRTSIPLVEVLQGMTRTLWIDAICIHPSSVEEKNYQIPVMGKIYS
jgi:hypothetical protein